MGSEEKKNAMKKPNYFIFGMIWLTAAAATFLQFVRSSLCTVLIRTGVFMLIGIWYMYANSKNKKKNSLPPQKDEYISPLERWESRNRRTRR